jgi:S-adenosylmethionine:tRNA ribosyltransferase-isomerase
VRVDDLDYHLPDELIAQAPADRRDAARLMVLPGDRPPAHHRFTDLPELLKPGDLLVLNDTRVLPARFYATRRGTGGAVEALFLETTDDHHWHVMLKSGGRLMPGERLTLHNDDAIELIEQQNDGTWIVRKDSTLDSESLLDRVGCMPLPPYIRRRRGGARDEADAMDRRRYQTVYAARAGAVAAPTAGLHFTDELMRRLADRGVQTARLTLHVGLGTFAPVRVDDLDNHAMHAERFILPADTLGALRAARDEGRRIIPVGTTSVRALESLPEPLPAETHAASTDLLIQPGFAFRFCDALITNFHLPRSTLIALVAARAGLERLLHAYHLAIEQRYRFYSYGDAMLILAE